jgi:hypothetical protein
MELSYELKKKSIEILSVGIILLSDLMIGENGNTVYTTQSTHKI